MSGHVIIVTGASAGIGRALAQRATNAGYRVFAVGRRTDKLAALSDSVSGAPGEIETLSVDLLTPGAAARIVAAALARFGGIDVLVNNAGTVAAGPVAQQSDAALREQLTLHVTVPLALTREALPSLRARRGHVFFVGSGVARIPVGGLGAYPSAKAAIRNAARIARNELRAEGIAVTYVDPGAVDTDFMRRAGFAGAPAGLALRPDAVARKILRAVGTRPAVLNAAPWQTAIVALAELVPRVTDAVVARFPGIVGATSRRAGSTATEPANTVVAQPQATEGDFDAALRPHAHRMERLKLSREFVAGLLQPGATLDADEVALRWAGMPNKNERSLVHDVLAALATSQFLEPDGPGRYRVSRGADYQ